MRNEKPRIEGNCSGTTFLDGTKKDRWYMRLRLPDGSQTRLAIGKAWFGRGRPPEGYFTQDMANAVLNARIAQEVGMSKGTDPIFSLAADEWLAFCEREGRTGTTMRTYRSIVERDLKPAFGKYQLSAITPQMMRKARDELANRPRYDRTKKPDTATPISSSTINQTKSILAGIYKLAKFAREYVGPDHTEYFRRAPTKPAADIDVYTPEEVLAIGEAALNLEDKAAFLTAGLTGIRLNELRALRLGGVNTEASILHVRGGYTDAGGFGTTKTKKIRTVPLVPQVSAVLTELLGRDHHTTPDDLVFCTPTGGVIDGNALYKRLREAATRAGVRQLRLHDMRHTFGTMAAQVYPLHDVQAYLGHSQVSTTMRYLHHKPHTDAAEKLGALISASGS